MSAPRKISVHVVTRHQDDVEYLNRVLRGSGFASQCHWHDNGEDFARAVTSDDDLIITRISPQLIEPAAIIELARKRGCMQPVILIAESIDEASISQALEWGAADLVTLRDDRRLGVTLQRELKLQLLDRQVAHSRSTAANIQQQFTSLLDDVPDAIAHVQEGIVVETNKAWLELFRCDSEDDCLAHPLMDMIAAKHQSTIKGALVAIAKGKWNDEPLAVVANRQDGKEIELTLSLQQAVFDDEPAVRIAIKQEKAEDKRTTSLMRDAMTKDQSTFLYHRKHFLKMVEQRLGQPLDRGERLMAWIRIDNFKKVRNELGVICSEDIIADFAELLRQCIQKEDIAGRFEGTAFTVLLERSSENDAKAWGRQFAKAVADRLFEIGDRTINLTCSVGICANSDVVTSSAELVEMAEKTYRDARDRGDGKVLINETSDEDTRIRKHDKLWAHRLTEALKDNRFRLLKQPIAALDGDSAEVFDILMRLVDEQGQTIAPSEFLPAARRNNMMQALDRWVIGASLSLSRQHNPDLLFVRLSEQSITDRSFAAWLKTIIAKSGVSPASLCFQVPEETALKYLKAVAVTATAIRKIGCKFALEHVGIAPQSEKLMTGLPLDFVKIDGSLIGGLAGDGDGHEKTSALVAVAKARNIKTIAEKVQDANTMAALWQLGISYMQGHYVQEPEVILQETA
ncbi:MAG: EAL domain-containing protein [Pseudomonadota bacterium]